MLMHIIIALTVKKTSFHDLSEQAPTTAPASSHILILSLSPPHTDGPFSLSCHRAFAQALPDSWDSSLFLLHLVNFYSSLR